MENNAEAGPSRLPAYTPAAQRRRSTRSVRQTSKDAIPVIERHAGSDLQRAESLDGGLATSDVVMNGTSSSSSPPPATLPAAATSRRRSAKRKSDQMCDEGEQQEGGGSIQPACMREDDVAEQSSEQPRSDEDVADEQVPTKRAREGEAESGVEDAAQQGVEAAELIKQTLNVHDHGGGAEAPASPRQEQLQPSQEPLQKSLERSQPARQAQRNDEGDEHAMEAIVQDDISHASEHRQGDAAASQPSIHDGEEKVNVQADIDANAVAAPSTSIAARGPPASLPLPQGNPSLDADTSFQPRSVSQSASNAYSRGDALHGFEPTSSATSQAVDEQGAAASQLEPQLAQPRSPSSAPASPSGILDDLHQIGEEISQKSSWEHDEEMDAERESCRDVIEDEAREPYISEEEATQQPIAGTLAQELMRRALAPEETTSSLRDDAAEEGTSAYMDVVADAALLDGQPLLSQWSEEPWQASDPFRTSTPAQALDETTLSTSSINPPPPTSPPKHHGHEDEAPQPAAAPALPEDIPTSSPSTHVAASSPGPSSSSAYQHHGATRPSPSVEHRRRRQISRSISRRSRESFFDDGDEDAGDAFWDQVIDAADEQYDGAEDDAGEEWDLGDADMTLSQIDHDANGAALRSSDDEENEAEEPALPQAIPAGAFAGFSTAANRRLPEPDAAAMERARRAFEIEETDAELDIRRLAAGKAVRRTETEAKEASESAPQEEAAPQALKQARPQQHAESPQHEQEDDRDNDYTLEEQPVPAVIPQFVSFQKANGAALQLSKAAMEEAAKRMATWEAEHETRVPEPRRELSNGGPSSSRPSTPLASRLNGAPAATALTRSPLAPTASPHANRIVDVVAQQDKEQAAVEESLASRSASSTSQRSSQLRPDAPVEQPPATPAAAPVALPTFTPRAVPPPPPSLPSQAPQQMATPIRPVANRSFFSTSSVPHNPTSSASAFSPGPGASPAPRRPRLDARPSRISLGMTPRAKVGGTPGSSRAVFRTPFKGSASGTPSVRPPLFSSMSATAAPQSPFVVPSASRSPTKGPSASTSRGALAPTASDPSVFDLSPREGRLSLKEYGMIPPTPPSSRQRHQQQLARQQQQHLITVLPAEIATILRSPTEAGRFAFKSPDSGEAFGIRHALAELHRSGATHIDEAWVRNHSCLIVWKLAAYVRVCVQAYPQAQAPLAVKAACEQWWTFDAAFRQLLYRYEREVNLAQRSVVKRVYEHDSPPGLPMVLLVSAVRSDGEANAPLLELSDGWYRIPACVDAPLTRAIQRGKIRPGQKLALQGATLTSSNGGSAAGPKDPLSTSTAGSQPCLSLCGNGTSLATWDARLGARKDPMIATLRSLTPDGGAVPCMDIVITRLFPVAYCDGGGAGGGGGSSSSAGAGGGAPATTTASFGRWGAAEEAEAQREWERRYEDCRARLAAEAEKEAQAVADLQELLRGYLDDSSAEEQGEDDDGSADSAASHLFDELVNTDNMAAAALVLRHGLAELSSSRSNVIRQLVSMAAARAESQRMQWSGDVEAKLAKMCPRRRVRSFRVCRFVDAASRSEGVGSASQLRRPCKRTVQLTIWDVDGLGGGDGGGKKGAGADGFLAQSHRYRVTNLMPAQKYAWRGADVEADVFLATRRDSRWMRI